MNGINNVLISDENMRGFSDSVLDDQEQFGHYLYDMCRLKHKRFPLFNSCLVL